MKRMSYVLLCAVVLLAAACSDNDSQPAVKKDKLGLIVPQNNQFENLLLLEDGTLTRPVSGISDFNTRAVGEKLLINYRKQGVENGVTNIIVTHFAEANDSTFIPDPVTPSLEDSIYNTRYEGRYYIANADSTEMYVGNITFIFGSKQTGNSSYTYMIDPDGESSFTGEGEFELTDGNLVFSNGEHDNIMVPAGEFVASLGLRSLYLWPVEFDGLYFTYALNRDE